MGQEGLKSSLDTLKSEFDWLSDVIMFRFSDYFRHEEQHAFPQPPDVTPEDCYYAQVLTSLDFDLTNRLILLVALAPHIRPSALDVFFTKNEQIDRGFSEFGGLKGEKHSGFIPTAETASFVVAGDDLEQRYQVQERLDVTGVFHVQNLISVGQTNAYEPFWSGELVVSQELLAKLTLNRPYRPKLSPSFPAELLTTELNWEDAVLDPTLRAELQHLQSWIQHESVILKDPNHFKFLKSGYRALFYGPPGTGKSMTAALLGKASDVDVFRIDLSAVVSKYIGETEKNLARLFDVAEHKNWILFFDEADSLFSKRTATRSSNDMFANQQVSFLLQRIEAFNGLVILASNFKENMDEAFLRRFQSIVAFHKPDVEMRKRLWQQYFEGYQFAPGVIEDVAQKYEITGGSIINVLRYCAILAAERGTRELSEADLLKGIKRELMKDGVTM